MRLTKPTAKKFIDIGRNYDVIDRQTSQALAMENSDSLAIWVFIFSQPPNWIPYKEHIKKN